MTVDWRDRKRELKTQVCGAWLRASSLGHSHRPLLATDYWLLAAACLLSTVYCLLSTSAHADWPQWRGPDRTDLSKETGLLKSWAKQGPPLVWTYAECGAGYSGPAVVGDRLYIMGARGDTEFLIAIDVKSGKEVWGSRIGPTFTFKGNEWGDGPRATPTVDGSAVFAQGGQGDLGCADTAPGNESTQ